MKYIMDTNALAGAPSELVRAMAPVMTVPLVVVHELLHQLSNRRQEAVARRALVKLATTEESVIGEHHYNVVRKAFGRRSIAHPRERALWWKLIRVAAMGASWEEVKASWDRSYTLGDTAFEASIFQTMKSNRKDFERQYLAMAAHFAEQHQRAAQKAGMTKDQVGRKEAREFIRGIERKAGAVLEVALLCQLAAMAGIREAQEGLDRILESGKGDPIKEMGELFMTLVTDFDPSIHFGLEMTLRSQMMYIRKQWKPEGNDFFDLLVMLSVDARAGDVFVTNERRWQKAARLSNWEDGIATVEQVKRKLLL